MFGFLLFLSTGLTVCYSFLYFILCGDFNHVSFYSMVETGFGLK